jgi:hypothetical protein
VVVSGTIVLAKGLKITGSGHKDREECPTGEQGMSNDQVVSEFHSLFEIVYAKGPGNPN